MLTSWRFIYIIPPWLESHAQLSRIIRTTSIRLNVTAGDDAFIAKIEKVTGGDLSKGAPRRQRKR